MGNKKKRKHTKPMRWTDNPKIAKRGAVSYTHLTLPTTPYV